MQLVQLAGYYLLFSEGLLSVDSQCIHSDFTVRLQWHSVILSEFSVSSQYIQCVQ